ncbi:hypothetical protein K2Y11_09655 [bacterium]|nr:hypothetical protein [bacterium]
MRSLHRLASISRILTTILTRFSHTARSNGDYLFSRLNRLISTALLLVTATESHSDVITYKPASGQGFVSITGNSSIEILPTVPPLATADWTATASWSGLNTDANNQQNVTISGQSFTFGNGLQQIQIGSNDANITGSIAENLQTSIGGQSNSFSYSYPITSAGITAALAPASSDGILTGTLGVPIPILVTINYGGAGLSSSAIEMMYRWRATVDGTMTVTRNALVVTLPPQNILPSGFPLPPHDPNYPSTIVTPFAAPGIDTVHASSFIVGFSETLSAASGSGSTNVDSVSWAQPQSGQWLDENNWSPSVAPQNSIDVHFELPSSSGYAVTLASTSEAKSLTVTGDTVTLDTAGQALHVAGVLNVESGSGRASLLALAGTGTVAADGGVSIFKDNKLEASTTIVGEVRNAGNLDTTDSHYRTVTIAGNYNQFATGTMIGVVDPSGQTSTSNLAVSGSASLAGTLQIKLPGTTGQPNPLPSHNQTYELLSASKVSGTFNQDNKIVEAKFAGDNKTAGLFDVSYPKNNSVTLGQFHQVHFLSVGLDDAVHPVHGQIDANKIQNTLVSLPGVIIDNASPLLLPETKDNGITALTKAIKAESQLVHPGDTFVFYISTHGSFGNFPEAPSETQLTRDVPASNGATGTFTSSAQTELYLGPDAGDLMTARAFSDLFDNSLWDDVNKLFIMDTCYSAGFWQDIDGSHKYLAELHHSSILAAATEATVARDNTFATPVANAFTSIAGDITFDALAEKIKANYQVQIGTTGWLKPFPIDNIDGPPTITEQPQMYSAATADFNMGLLGTTAVPEPPTLTLLISFAVISAIYRWQYYRQSAKLGRKMVT